MTQAIDRPKTQLLQDSTFTNLKCKECGTTYAAEAKHVCEECFGPLEVVYDYDAIRRQVSRESIEAGPNSIWRYKAFLPVASEEPIEHPRKPTPPPYLNQCVPIRPCYSLTLLLLHSSYQVGKVIQGRNSFRVINETCIRLSKESA